MKKLLIVIASLFISVGIMAQEPVKKQTQTKKQTKEQVQTPTQSGDPIMTQERVNEGQGNIKRAEKKEKKMNHGRMVSETAKGTESGPGKGEAVSGMAKQNRDGVQQHDRDQVNKQAKPRTGARPPMQGTTPARTGMMQRGGRK